MRPHLVSLQSANWFDMKAWNILCGYSQSPTDPTSNIFPLPVLLPVKKCETFPELFHISLLFPVPFPEAAPQQPVCLLVYLLVYLLVCLHVVPLLDRCFYKPWKNTGDPESHALSPHIPDAFPHLLLKWLQFINAETEEEFEMADRKSVV